MALKTLFEAMREKGTGKLTGSCMTPNKVSLKEVMTRDRNRFALVLTTEMKLLDGTYRIKRRGERDKSRSDTSVQNEMKGLLRIADGMLATITIRFDSVCYFGTYTIELLNKEAFIENLKAA